MLRWLRQDVFFEWDRAKEVANVAKHGVTFAAAQQAFSDPQRVIAEDLKHSNGEKRFYCFGMVDEGDMTVRFTFRQHVIRIYGAGYWRKGQIIYETENQIHRGSD